MHCKSSAAGKGRGALGRTVLLLIAGLTFATIAADLLSRGEARPWIEKDPARWTLGDAELVLWKSPWVTFKTYRYFATPFRAREAYFYVRIQSALPVRLAVAKAFRMQPERNVVRAGPVDQQDVERIAKEVHIENELVLAVIGFPPPFHQRLNEQNPELLMEKTSLEIGREKLALKAFVKPEASPFGEAWFRFPRPSIDANTPDLRFSTTLQVPRPFKVTVDFDPGKLVFVDHLEY